MSTCDKGGRNEREALAQDIKSRWKFMPGSRAVRTRYNANDLFNVWDYAVYFYGTGTNFEEAHAGCPYDEGGYVFCSPRPFYSYYLRKYVQVVDAKNAGARRKKCLEWLKMHRFTGELYELAVYRDAHWAGRGKNKKWMKKSWRRESL